MPLTEKEIDAIREEAERLYPDIPQVRISTIGVVQAYHEAKRQAHIAAVTAERERAKVLLDSANKIKTWIVAHPKKATIYRPVIEEFFNAIKQYTNEQ